MKDLLILLAHLLTTVAKLLGPGGARSIVLMASHLAHKVIFLLFRSASYPIFRLTFFANLHIAWIRFLTLTSDLVIGRDNKIGTVCYATFRAFTSKCMPSLSCR